ncbi:MAG TPA: DUF1223 domain-containing protein [Candidatus Omnitrophota bacterium]|nr:DUF1223 domain-containing protein [Candidatus Omnitrophota bacterium]
MSKDTRPKCVTAALAALLFLGAVSRAEGYESGPRQVHLVELYTSEGCSSCPPADEWLSRLKKSGQLWSQVVPVAFHVDFWDYIGWPDPYAQRSFTRRLQAIVSGWTAQALYTPCVVQNGLQVRNWYELEKFQRSRERPGLLKATLVSPDTYEITFEPSEKPQGELVAFAALLGMGFISEVKEGENKGRTLRHDFVALDMRSVDMTAENGVYKARLSFVKNPKERSRPAQPQAIALWVSSKNSPVPIQATGGWLD